MNLKCAFTPLACAAFAVVTFPGISQAQYKFEARSISVNVHYPHSGGCSSGSYHGPYYDSCRGFPPYTYLDRSSIQRYEQAEAFQNRRANYYPPANRSYPVVTHDTTLPRRVSSRYKHLAQRKPAVARFKVRCPENATLFFDGKLISGSGETRLFRTPNLNLDKKWEYTVRARWIVEGRTNDMSAKIKFKAGDQINVDFLNRTAVGQRN